MIYIKKFISKLLLLVLTVMTLSMFYGISVKATAVSYVNDFVGVTSEETKQLVEEKNKELKELNNTQIHVTVIKSLDGQNLNIYSKTLFDYINPKEDDKKNNISVLLIIEGCESSIVVGKDMQQYISDNDALYIKDKYLTPALYSKNYNEAIIKVVNGLSNYINMVTMNKNENNIEGIIVTQSDKDNATNFIIPLLLECLEPILSELVKFTMFIVCAYIVVRWGLYINVVGIDFILNEIRNIKIKNKTPDKDKKMDSSLKVHSFSNKQKVNSLNSSTYAKEKDEGAYGLSPIRKITDRSDIDMKENVNNKIDNTVIGKVFEKPQKRKEIKDYLLRIKNTSLRVSSIALKDTVKTFTLTIDNAFDEQLWITVDCNYVKIVEEVKDNNKRILKFYIFNPIEFAKAKRFKITVRDENQRSATGYITVTKEIFRVKDYLKIKVGDTTQLEIHHSPLEEIEIDDSITDKAVVDVSDINRSITGIAAGYTTLTVKNVTDNTERLVSISVDDNISHANAILGEVAEGNILETH